MSEKEYSGQIRFSYGVSHWWVVLKSLSLLVILYSLVLLDDALSLSGSSLVLISVLLLIFIIVNLLGYIELAVASPRKGGSYRLVQTSEDSNLLAYLTGWLIILAGICVASVLLHVFAHQTSALLTQLFNITLPELPIAAVLLVVSAAIKLLPAVRRQRDFFLLLLLGILLVGVLAVAPRISLDNFRPLQSDWKGTFSLLLMAYIAVEFASEMIGDLRDSSRHSPRVLLLSTVMGSLAATLIGAIALGVLGGGNRSPWGNPLADLAGLLGGKWASGIMAGLSLLTILFALSRVLSFLIRKFYLMTRDGFWPDFFLKTTPRTKSPYYINALLLLLLSSSLFIPTTYLMHLGSLFYLLVLMIINLTLARQDQMVSSFQLPIHPWIPALVLVLDMLLILVWAEFLPAAAGLILVGLIIFLVYGRNHSIVAKEGITVFKTAVEEETAKQHTRILVPIANPETAESLLHLAGTLVRSEGGKVIALRVVTVPSQLPLSDGRTQAEADRLLLDRAIDQATKEEFRVQTMTRVSRSVAEGILDTAREEDVDQILVGWSGGEPRSLSKSLGPVLDPIVKDAPCDVLIVKGHNWKEINSILVPAAGGPNAPIGARLAWTLSQSSGAKVTGLYVQVGRASSSRMAENRRILAGTFEGLEFSQPPELKVIIANTVESGIISEAENYDLVIVGASEQGFIDQFAFGSIPQRIASQSPHSSVMVKGYGGAPEFMFRKVLQMIFNLFPTLTTEEQLEVRDSLIDNAQPGRDYFIMIGLSSIIATLGLLLNSPAVVIGAMLVAPLMSPILGLSLGIVLGEIGLIRTSLESVFKGTMATIIVAVLVGLISPLKDMTPEIMARTQPTLLDLFIALASGMAGAYALSREDVSAALPGVAIAAALAPPLGVVGIGLATGNLHAAGGAFLLFITNIITISLAGVIIFTLLGIHPLNLQPEIKKRVRRGITGVAFLVLLITIPLAVLMNGIIRQSREDQIIERLLLESPYLQNAEIMDIQRTQSGDQMLISATVKSTGNLTQEQVIELAQALENELGRKLTLDIITLPVISSGP
jgi:uncharacterized hydrophobic protein (TIGR00271 family)